MTGHLSDQPTSTTDYQLYSQNQWRYTRNIRFTSFGGNESILTNYQWTRSPHLHAISGDQSLPHGHVECTQVKLHSTNTLMTITSLTVLCDDSHDNKNIFCHRGMTLSRLGLGAFWCRQHPYSWFFLTAIISSFIQEPHSYWAVMNIWLSLLKGKIQKSDHRVKDKLVEKSHDTFTLGRKGHSTGWVIESPRPTAPVNRY